MERRALEPLGSLVGVFPAAGPEELCRQDPVKCCSRVGSEEAAWTQLTALRRPDR